MWHNVDLNFKYGIITLLGGLFYVQYVRSQKIIGNKKQFHSLSELFVMPILRTLRIMNCGSL
jgi:hypothetical protein